MDEQERISGLFAEAPDPSVAMQVIMEWGRARTSSRSNVAMTSYVFNTKSFKEHVDSVFGSVYHAMLGGAPPGLSDPSTRGVLQKGFVNEVVIPSFLVRKEDAFGFIKARPEFVDHVKAQLKVAHEFYRTDNFDIEHEKRYLIQFKELFRFECMSSMDAVVQTVVKTCTRAGVGTVAKPERVSSAPLRDSRNEYFVEQYRKRMGKDPSVYTLGDVNRFFVDEIRLVDAYLEHLGGNYDLEFDRLTRQFRAKFDREITAYELRFLQRGVLEKGVNETVDDYYALFTKRFNMFSSMFRSYFEREPDVFDFVHEAIRHINKNDGSFEDAVVRLFVTYPEYERCTTHHIARYVQETFGVTIQPRDAEYFYTRIAEDRMCVHDERMPSKITALYEEYMQHLTEIIELFSTVLRREPDQSEIALYIEYYRAPSTKSVRVVIEDELYDGLEYQYIVKGLLSELYPDIGRHVVFKYMTDLVNAGMAQFRSKEAIREFLS